MKTYVGAGLEHVVSMPSGDGDEWDGIAVVSDLLEESADLLLDLLVTLLGVLGLSAVHLVDGNDHLLHSEGEGEESVLTGLTILGDTSLELTDTSGDDENGSISLKTYIEYTK